MTTSDSRQSLQGIRVGLSIGNSDDSRLSGDNHSQLARVTSQAVEILGQHGARLVFGHVWSDAGVLRSLSGGDGGDRDQSSSQATAPADFDSPQVHSLVPWGQPIPATMDGPSQHGTGLQIESAGLPPDLRDLPNIDQLVDPEQTEEFDQLARAYLTARGLTYLRRRIIAATDARICAGGKRTGYSGRLPGVVEEALFALDIGQPIYLTGLLGGAARQVISALLGETLPGDFAGQPADVGQRVRMSDLYHHPPIPNHALELQTQPAQWYEPEDASWLEPTDVWQRLSRYNLATLSAGNGLSEDENQQLFEATSLDEFVRLILLGLSRVRGRDCRAD